MGKFGVRLKKLRKEKSLRQKDLADILGLAQTTIANYEQNTRFPNEEILKKLSDYFNVSFDYLLGRTNVYQTNESDVLYQEIEKSLTSLSEIYKDYIEYLLEGKKTLATKLIIQSVKLGIDIRDIYMYVFEPALKHVGHLWELGKITVADEHYFSLVTEHIMSILYTYIDIYNKKNYSLAALSSSGERHTIGIRMISDLFEIEGWDTYFLGSNTPTNSIIKTIVKYDIDLLAISVTMDYHINSAQSIIHALRDTKDCKSIKIIVGGNAFNNDSKLWERIGADGFATTAVEAVNLGSKLMKRQKINNNLKLI